MLKRPSVSVTAVLTPCGPVAVTVTPGTASPWASTMRPFNVPVVSCAIAGITATMNAKAAIIATRLMPRIALSSVPLIAYLPPRRAELQYFDAPRRTPSVPHPNGSGYRFPSGTAFAPASKYLMPTGDHNASYICQLLLFSLRIEFEQRAIQNPE